MHASTNLHIAERFKDEENDEFYRNWYKFYYSVGAYPDRAKNMYLTYSLLIRALNLVKDQMILTDYSAGICQADASMTFPHITELLTTTD